MKTRRAIYTIALALALLANGLALPAFAQFGIGFGSWGSHFGTWVEFWPWRRYHAPQESRPAPPVAQNNGYLEGNVAIRPICPASQPNVACPLAPGMLNNITISAQPYGSNQWLSSPADAQGHYRLALAPGGYNVTVQHPYLNETNKILRQIIIQPGQTNRQNFQINMSTQ